MPQDLPLADFTQLADANFAQEVRARYLAQRLRMQPEIQRWLNVTRMVHPRGLDGLEAHWSDPRTGAKLRKLFESRGLSVEVWAPLMPYLEIYGSLLAGQKPLPFTLDVPPLEVTRESEVRRADMAEKIILDELYDQQIPLAFLDFVVSVIAYGIGYVCSWIDDRRSSPRHRRLRTEVFPFPGDVFPVWGSSRYGRGGDALEAVMFHEQMQLDAARRLYRQNFFGDSEGDAGLRPDGSPLNTEAVQRRVTVVKYWYRWQDDAGAEKIGYAEVALEEGADQNNRPRTGAAVLKRTDDTGYPDIPVRWAARFQTPGLAPHQSSGAFDNVLGMTVEFNEKMSAYSDWLMSTVYPKLVGKNMTAGSVPKLQPGSNIYPIAANQDLRPLYESTFNNFPWDNYLSRLDSHILTNVGLSRLMLGTLPPGETSGEALNNLLHAAISRLEVVRTPIEWAWKGLITEIWMPLMRDFYKTPRVADPITGELASYTLRPILEGYTRVQWTWPDVTPRDSLRAVQLALQLGQAGYLADESVMERARVASPVDEMTRIRKQKQDEVMHPNDVRNTLLVQQVRASLKQMEAQLMAQIQQSEGGAAAEADGTAKAVAQARDMDRKAMAHGTARFEDDNTGVLGGSEQNAAQGYAAQEEAA